MAKEFHLHAGGGCVDDFRRALGVFIGQSILAGEVAAMMIDSHRMWSVLYGMLVESDTGFIVEIDTYGL